MQDVALTSQNMRPRSPQSLAAGESAQSHRQISRSLLMELLQEQKSRLSSELQINEKMSEQIYNLQREKVHLMERLSETETLKRESDLKVKELEQSLQALSEKRRKVEAQLERQVEETMEMAATLDESRQRWKHEESCHVLEQAQIILQLMKKVTALQNRIAQLQQEPSLRRKLKKMKERIRLKLTLGNSLRKLSLWRPFHHVFRRRRATEIYVIPTVSQPTEPLPSIKAQ